MKKLITLIALMTSTHASDPSAYLQNRDAFAPRSGYHTPPSQIVPGPQTECPPRKKYRPEEFWTPLPLSSDWLPLNAFSPVSDGSPLTQVGSPSTLVRSMVQDFASKIDLTFPPNVD